MTDSQALQIEQPTGASLIACAGFLYDQIPLADRAKLVAELMRQSAAGKVIVVSAQEHERLVAAVAAQIVPGRQGFVQPPKMTTVANDRVLGKLWEELETELRRRGVDYLQAILPSETDATLLEHVGMQNIAKLCFLSADAAAANESADSAIEFAPFDESQTDRMRGLIEETYAESEDCPAVDGMRSTDDVIEGYRGAGKYIPSNWFFVREGEKDIGCLLLADHPNSDQLELVYMGLIVPARGKGLGKAIAEYARSQTAAAGRARIHVAVDVSNTPAIQTYTRAGYHLTQEQQVLAKSLS